MFTSWNQAEQVPTELSLVFSFMLRCYCYSNPKKTRNQECLHRCICYCRVSPEGCSTEEWIQVLEASRAWQPQLSSLSSHPLPLPLTFLQKYPLDYLLQSPAREAVIWEVYWCQPEFSTGFRSSPEVIIPLSSLFCCKLKHVLAGLKQVFQFCAWTEKHLNVFLNDLWN